MAELVDARRLLDRRVWVPVIAGLALLIGYQVWAWRSHANAVQTTAKVNRTSATRTATTCPQVAFLYGTIVRLMQNDPTITASDVAAMRRQGTVRVAACKASTS